MGCIWTGIGEGPRLQCLQLIHLLTVTPFPVLGLGFPICPMRWSDFILTGFKIGMGHISCLLQSLHCFPDFRGAEPHPADRASGASLPGRHCTLVAPLPACLGLSTSPCIWIWYRRYLVCLTSLILCWKGIRHSKHWIGSWQSGIPKALPRPRGNKEDHW